MVTNGLKLSTITPKCGYILANSEMVVLIILFSFQHFKITGPELTISSVGDAITCRIAARDSL